MATVGERILLALFHRFPPAGETIFKTPDPRPEQEYESENLPDRFLVHFSEHPDLFEGAEVLDLGSGFGGRSVKFLEYGAKSVVGVEVTDEHVVHGNRFAEERGVDDRARFLLGTGEDIPCEDETFDLVTMMDVMEHVIDPARVLEETWRVLRAGGRLAVVFPPYYDVSSGSHLHGYATRLPGLNSIFRTKTLRSATRTLVLEQGVDFDHFFRDVSTDKLWNQNGLTARGFRKIVAASRYEPEWVYYMGHLQYRRAVESGSLTGRGRLVYRAAQAVAQAPGVQELTCARVCALLRKS